MNEEEYQKERKELNKIFIETMKKGGFACSPKPVIWVQPIVPDTTFYCIFSAQIGYTDIALNIYQHGDNLFKWTFSTGHLHSSDYASSIEEAKQEAEERYYMYIFDVLDKFFEIKEIKN